MARVSICVCTYNQQDTLRETLESLLRQQGDVDLEILVGEDASTDNTREILLSAAMEDARIIPVLQEHNLGLTANFHSLLEQCSGDYICLCAGDDFWHDPLKLSKQTALLELEPQTGVVYTGVIRWHTDLPGQPRETYIPPELPAGGEFKALMHNNPIPAISVCFRKSLLRFLNLNQLRQQGFTIEDYPMWLEFSRHTRFVCIPEPTATYRITGTSISHSNQYDKNIRYQQAIFDIRDYFRAKYPDSGMSQVQADTLRFRRLANTALSFGKYAEARQFCRQIPLWHARWRGYLKMLLHSRASSR